MRATGSTLQQYDLQVNGKQYVRSPGHRAHDADYFHEHNTPFAADYNNERNSPDTMTKINLYNPLKYMNQIVDRDFRDLLSN